MSNIKLKRDSLQLYLREQIIGPGAGRNRIVKVDETLDYSFIENEYHTNNDESLSVVPGIYYSSGILFPKKLSENKVTNSEIMDFAIESNEYTNVIEDLDDNNVLEERNINDDNDVQMDQMYPKSMGLTFCMNADDLKNIGFDLFIEGRHYTRLNKELIKEYGIRIEIKKDLFLEVLNLNLGDFGKLENYFLIKDAGGYSFISQIMDYPKSPIFDSNGLELLDTNGRPKFKSINILNIASELIAKRFLIQYGHLFPQNYLNHEVVTIDSVLQYLTNKLLKSIIDENEQKVFYSASQELEKYQNILSHFIDANEIYNGRYGIWESKLLRRNIQIKGLELGELTKLIYKSDKLNNAIIIDENDDILLSLDEIIKVDLNNDQKASLSLNIQLSKDTRVSNNLLYCKILVTNSSTPFQPTESNYFSMASEGVNEKSFFGLECKVISEHLKPYNDRIFTTAIDDKESDINRFQYRQFKDYGIGHGCSVSWGKNYVKSEYMPNCDIPDIDSVPRDVSLKPIDDNAPEFLQNTRIQEIKYLSTLSEASDIDIINGLNNFVDAYNLWISNKYRISENLINESDKNIAILELEKCSSDYKRLKHNINNYLVDNSKNLAIFRLMNTSMLIQMWHGKYAGSETINDLINHENFKGFNLEFYKNVNDDIFQDGISASWRAFQLAFIILNLDSIFDDNIDNINRNELVDLVWFPTGGGKTEAYLGLISLTILNRRIKYGENGGGTAAIMRYTLRLLTLQQFQRASKLIMALELIRRGSISFGFDLGLEPIRIGLYVGDNQIPNKTSDKIKGGGLIQEFDKLNENFPSKIPFSHCICCGSKIQGLKNVLNSNDNDYNHDIGRLCCTNSNCSMSIPVGPKVKERPDMGFLPLLLSDEAIYQHPPALLFGTVDKFAQLAHKIDNSSSGRSNDSRRLFGRGNWEKYKPKQGYLPPDLIIQDELHLLLGPLGTGVALFESAFEQLCTRHDGTKPKVISSTATTRNTDLQIEALFNKKLNIFPKQGIDCDDSFFGIYKRKYYSNEIEDFKYISKRRYIGFLPTGRTQVWMQMRIDALCLAHRALFELKYQLGDTISPLFTEDFKKAQNYYYTIVSYFNSVKEVGRTQAQVQTYILKEARKVLNRSMRSDKLLKSIYVMKSNLVEAELTGRLTGEEVKRELARVENNWTPNRFPISVNEDDKVVIKQQYNIIPEFVVATNMISVGLDVSRFNTIVMNSMPRNTAEYIQASSRVARNDLGLVLTVHHPFRARDISHYEKFIEFHEKMYSYVEPISITPFTKNSIDKFMPLYIATIIRHFFVDFSDRITANDVTVRQIEKIKKHCILYFEKRYERLSQNPNSVIRELLTLNDLNYIKSWIDQALSSWVDGKKIVNDNNLKLVFKNANMGNATGESDLFCSINNLNIKEYQKKWQVGMSLRNIEPTAVIHVNKF